MCVYNLEKANYNSAIVYARECVRMKVNARGLTNELNREIGIRRAFMRNSIVKKYLFMTWLKVIKLRSVHILLTMVAL